MNLQINKNTMNIKIHTQHLNLAESQEEMLYAKFEKLITYADRLSDESAEMKVNLSFEKSKKPEDAYLCELTIFVPMDTLRAESRDESLSNVVDDVIEKMKSQIEHYKAKIHQK
ncbi:ribosome-associated translation inhibitor RaiA [Patescibacteria group bacterium]|nr:ribosome-associated translation inhibitor RaiA [Patescibacteria group bacterium]